MWNENSKKIVAEEKECFFVRRSFDMTISKRSLSGKSEDCKWGMWEAEIGQSLNFEILEYFVMWL